MNADVLTDLNYQELIAYHRHHGVIATVSAYERQVAIDLGVIIKDGDCRIQDYVEKPSYTHLVSMGVYVFEPRIMDYVKNPAKLAGLGNQMAKADPHHLTPEIKKGKAPGYLDFPDLIKLLLSLGQPVNYYHFDGYWLDIGRHDDYTQASEDFNKFQALLGYMDGPEDSRNINKT
jgi:NDP-sugar pyrophosphorylase family protein